MKKVTLVGDVLYTNSIEHDDTSITHILVIKEPAKNYRCEQCKFVTHYQDVLEQHIKYLHDKSFVVSASNRPTPMCVECKKTESFVDDRWRCINLDCAQYNK